MFCRGMGEGGKGRGVKCLSPAGLRGRLPPSGEAPSTTQKSQTSVSAGPDWHLLSASAEIPTFRLSTLLIGKRRTLY